MTEENQEQNEENKDDLLKNDGKDLQRLQSWLGRVEKNQKDMTDKFASIAERLESMSSQGPQKPEFGDDEQAKFNEKLHEMILNGNVTEAFKIYQNVERKAQSLIKQKDQKQFESAISSLAEDPIMKNEDLAKKVTESAQALMQQGYSPDAAVRTAKVTVENEALKNMAQTSGTVNLDMLGGGGKQPPQTKEKTLPPGAERAYQQGKEKGYFKNREEYLENLDPRVRAEWGL